MNDALELSGLARTFGRTTVLAGVELSLSQGERLAVMGASGSGKTTLLRLIAGLDVPTAGEISLAGRAVSAPGRLLVPPERRGVAMVFQGLALFPHLRALGQVAYPAGDRRHAQELLDRVGLGHRSSTRLEQLSGGERQRVALARALAQKPRLMLMDEPFASLDDDRRAEMRGLLRSLLREISMTVILVTHSRDDALDLASRVLVLDGGRIAVSDTVEAALVDPRHAAAVRCLGLGQLIDGDADRAGWANTIFGAVAMDRPAAGRVKLLVRSAQASLADEGVAVTVESVEVRPPSTDGVIRIAVVRREDATLRVHVNRPDIAVGDTVRVRINGPCVPVAD